MAILFSRIVARVENLEPSYVDEKHTCAKDVASMVWCKRNARAGDDYLMGGNCDDGGEGHAEVKWREQRFCRGETEDKISFYVISCARAHLMRKKSCMMNL